MDATMLKIISQVSIPAPRVLSGGRNHAVPSFTSFKSLPPRDPAASRFRSFAAIGLSCALDGRRDRILATRRSILAALDQVIRAFAKFFRLALREIAALVGLLRKKFP